MEISSPVMLLKVTVKSLGKDSSLVQSVRKKEVIMALGDRGLTHVLSSVVKRTYAHIHAHIHAHTHKYTHTHAHKHTHTSKGEILFSVQLMPLAL